MCIRDRFLQRKGVCQGCSASPVLFNLCLGEAIITCRIWDMSADCGFKLNYFKLSTLLCADDQILLSGSEYALPKAFNALEKMIKGYNLNIYTEKSKRIALCGKQPIKEKIVLNYYFIEQVKVFNYLGCDMSSSHFYVKTTRFYYPDQNMLYQKRFILLTILLRDII